LTANLLRVTRGAGNPYAIVRQATAFVEALVEYGDAAGGLFNSVEITNSLRAEPDGEPMRRLKGEHLAQYLAEQAVIRGALQIVASRLLGQRTQEATGHHEMYDGVNELEEIRAERRKRLLAPAKSARRRDNEWDDVLERVASQARVKPTRKRTNKRGSGKKRRAGEGTKT
jgi:hypothetical protein